MRAFGRRFFTTGVLGRQNRVQCLSILCGLLSYSQDAPSAFGAPCARRRSSPSAAKNRRWNRIPRCEQPRAQAPQRLSRCLYGVPWAVLEVDGQNVRPRLCRRSQSEARGVKPRARLQKRSPDFVPLFLALPQQSPLRSLFSTSAARIALEVLRFLMQSRLQTECDVLSSGGRGSSSVEAT